MTIREELELREQSLLARESSWSIRSQGRDSSLQILPADEA